MEVSDAEVEQGVGLACVTLGARAEAGRPEVIGSASSPKGFTFSTVTTKGETFLKVFQNVFVGLTKRKAAGARC